MSDFFESMMNNLYMVSLEASAKESAHVFCLVQKVSRVHYEVFGCLHVIHTTRMKSVGDSPIEVIETM